MKRITYYSEILLGLFFSFLSGIADGTLQTILFHYSAFAVRFPNANPFWWNPALSWNNKGDNFFMRTALAFMTDAYHMSHTLSFLFISLSAYVLGYSAPSFTLRNWWFFSGSAIGIYVFKAAGFHLIYTFVFS